jgi:hypothetical protein
MTPFSVLLCAMTVLNGGTNSRLSMSSVNRLNACHPVMPAGMASSRRRSSQNEFARGCTAVGATNWAWRSWWHTPTPSWLTSADADRPGPPAAARALGPPGPLYRCFRHQVGRPRMP